MVDLDSRAQIHDLVVAFYREVVMDEVLGPVFDEVAEVDWAAHIPKLIDFWCRVLLGQPGYDGLMLAKHQEVNDLERFRPELFDRWFALFVQTLDAGWSGPIAERARTHAARVGGSLSRRLIDTDWAPADLAGAGPGTGPDADIVSLDEDVSVSVPVSLGRLRT